MKYFLCRYDDEKWAIIKEFSDFDNMIAYLAKNDDSCCLNKRLFKKIGPWFTRNSRTYLDFINMNGNDTLLSGWTTPPSFEFGHDFSEPQYSIRPYMFIDEKNKIIDMRKYIPQINEKRQELINAEEKYWRYRPSLYEFEYRKGPVPGTDCPWFNDYKGHNKRYVPTAYRNIRKGALRRLVLSDEYKEFGRPCKRKLVSGWDLDESVISRYRSKSWKDKTRKRKQWM